MSQEWGNSNANLLTLTTLLLVCPVAGWGAGRDLHHQCGWLSVHYAGFIATKVASLKLGILQAVQGGRVLSKASIQHPMWQSQDTPADVSTSWPLQRLSQILTRSKVSPTQGAAGSLPILPAIISVLSACRTQAVLGEGLGS